MSEVKAHALALLSEKKFSELDRFLSSAPDLEQRTIDELSLLSLVEQNVSNKVLERPLENYVQKYRGDVPVSNIVTAARVKFELAKFEESLQLLIDNDIPKDLAEASEIAVLCLFNLKKYESGKSLLDYLLAQNPLRAIYWEWNILFSFKLGDPSSAIDSWQKFIELDGTFTQRIGVLGFVIRSYMLFGRLDEAQGIFDSYELHKDIENIDAAMFIADFEKQKGNLDRCSEILRQQKQKHPDVAEIQWNLALSCLASGNLNEGWLNYEARWDWVDFPSPKRHFAAPRWDGVASLNHKTILIWGEQGIGDQLRFLTLLPNLIDKYPNARIVLEVDAKLVKLTRTWFPEISDVWSMGLNDTRGVQDYELFDYQIPSGSLPRLYFSNSKLLGQSKFRLMSVSTKSRSDLLNDFADKYDTIVGISWRSMLLTPDRISDYLNAQAFRQLVRSTSEHTVGFVILQYSISEDEKRVFNDLPNVFVPTQDFTNEVDANAMYAGACDLLVSCGTVVATMAGIFGKPVISWCKFDDHVNLGQDFNPWFPNRYDIRVHPNWDKVKLLNKLSNVLNAYLSKASSRKLRLQNTEA